MADENKELDTKTFKIVVLGDTKAGKSNLISRYCFDSFTEYFHSTTEAQFSQQTLHSLDTSVKLQIWDIPGSERLFSSVRSNGEGRSGLYTRL